MERMGKGESLKGNVEEGQAVRAEGVGFVGAVFVVEEQGRFSRIVALQNRVAVLVAR